MKVVLFCGGFGLRLRDYSDKIPKPMVPIGYRPVLWHIMKYYAHFGHTDFILCLGYKADAIKRYFLEYDECLTNDFVLSGDKRAPELLRSDIGDWRITFVDTGLHANIGERLRSVRPYLEGEEMFLANYSDDLTDAPLDDWIRDMQARPEAVAGFMSVKPNLSFHCVTACEDGVVQKLHSVRDSDLRINGGYFILKRDIFEYLNPGEELVEAPFARLIAQKRLVAYAYDGFWGALDTFKDHQLLEQMHSSGTAPWELWRKAGSAEGVNARAAAH